MAYVHLNRALRGPAQQLVVTDTRFVAGFETHFTVSEEYLSFSEHDFRVVDVVTGQQAFFLAGKIVFFREQKTLYENVSSTPIWTMKHSWIKAFGRRYNFSHPLTRVALFSIKSHHRWFANQGKKLSADLSGESVVTLEASKMDKQAVVTLTTGANVIPIAKISRSLHSVRNVIGNVQDYDVTIAPNVDIALILAFVITLDEEGEGKDKSQRTGDGVVLPVSNPVDSTGTGNAASNYVSATNYPRYYIPSI